MKRPYGMLTVAFAAYLQAAKDAGIAPPRITQAMTRPGHVVTASAGTHDKDGIINGMAYSCAIDISIEDLTARQINAFETALYNVGFIGWWRRLPWWKGVQHMHFIWVNAPMKQSLRDQVHAWFAELDGLANEMPEAHAATTQAVINRLRASFLAHNPARG